MQEKNKFTTNDICNDQKVYFSWDVYLNFYKQIHIDQWSFSVSQLKEITDTKQLLFIYSIYKK